MKQVFIDTSAFAALVDKNDDNHAKEVLTFPAIFLIERSLGLPLSGSPILSLVIVIKIGLLTIKKSLKPLFRRRFQT